MLLDYVHEVLFIKMQVNIEMPIWFDQDFNRVINKPYTEAVEPKDRLDEDGMCSCNTTIII